METWVFTKSLAFFPQTNTFAVMRWQIMIRFCILWLASQCELRSIVKCFFERFRIACKLWCTFWSLYRNMNNLYVVSLLKSCKGHVSVAIEHKRMTFFCVHLWLHELDCCGVGKLEKLIMVMMMMMKVKFWKVSSCIKTETKQYNCIPKMSI